MKTANELNHRTAAKVGSTVMLCTEVEMERVFMDKIVTAKKHYRCDASEQWRRAGYTVDDCKTSEQRLMVEAAEADKWRILPGQAYRKVTGIHEGDFCTYRARVGMDAVCNDLELFDE